MGLAAEGIWIPLEDLGLKLVKIHTFKDVFPNWRDKKPMLSAKERRALKRKSKNENR